MKSRQAIGRLAEVAQVGGEAVRGGEGVNSDVPRPPWPAATISALDNGVTAVTIPGADHSFYSWTATDPPSFSLTTDQAFAGANDPNVSVAQLGGGVVAVATEGFSENLNFYWRSNSGGPWNIEELGYIGQDHSPPQVIAVTNAAGTPLVAAAAEGNDYSAFFYWQNVGSSTWQTEAFPAGTFGN